MMRILEILLFLWGLFIGYLIGLQIGEEKGEHQGFEKAENLYRNKIKN